MRRRAPLAAAAAATTGAAGCLGDGPGAERGDTGTDTPDEPTQSATESGDWPRLVDRSFEVTRVECGNDYGDYDVGQADGVVTVEGTVGGSNGCYSAELVGAAYDEEADRLSVEVEAVGDREEGEACTSCIVEIEYATELTFEGGGPGEIRVEQDGATGDSGTSRDSEGDSGESTPENGTDTESTATDA